MPGEHDTSVDDGKMYLERYGKNAKGRGWYSFNHKDVHFVGLSNVAALEGLGKLGPDQFEWLEADLKGQPASRPVVVFAHIPLWSVYPEWGWGTEDSAQALGYLKRFGSVTVLNGHIHQVMQKVEGSVTFHTAMSTAFPQPAPGTAKGPGPMKVPDDKLRSVLGITDVKSVMKKHSLAVVDSTLAPAGAAGGEVALFDRSKSRADRSRGRRVRRPFRRLDPVRRWPRASPGLRERTFRQALRRLPRAGSRQGRPATSRRVRPYGGIRGFVPVFRCAQEVQDRLDGRDAGPVAHRHGETRP